MDMDGIKLEPKHISS